MLLLLLQLLFVFASSFLFFVSLSFCLFISSVSLYRSSGPKPGFELSQFLRWRYFFCECSCLYFLFFVWSYGSSCSVLIEIWLGRTVSDWNLLSFFSCRFFSKICQWKRLFIPSLFVSYAFNWRITRGLFSLASWKVLSFVYFGNWVWRAGLTHRDWMDIDFYRSMSESELRGVMQNSRSGCILEMSIHCWEEGSAGVTLSNWWWSFWLGAKFYGTVVIFRIRNP